MPSTIRIRSPVPETSALMIWAWLLGGVFGDPKQHLRLVPYAPHRGS